jgi:secondary thiamine-phosphate synthase enzyme
MNEIRIRSGARNQMIPITDRLQEEVERSGVREGILVAQSLHTTAGLTINENADPDVARDMVAKLDRLAPQQEGFYRHAEGNSDSHVKTSLVGPSLTVLVSEGRLVLGTWQGVFVCEFDGPRERRIAVRILGGD